MVFFEQVMPLIGESIVGEFVAVVLGLLFVHVVQRSWNQWRYGGWDVIILQDGEQILKEKITADRRREFRQDRLAARVYLKGLASSYGWLHCDLLIEGREIGLFKEDEENKAYIIDLDRNPGPDETRPNRQTDLLDGK